MKKHRKYKKVIMAFVTVLLLALIVAIGLYKTGIYRFDFLKEVYRMRAKKLRTKVVGLVAAVMVVGAPLTAWAIDVAGGDLYYNGGQTDTIVYSEIGRKAGISRNYMVKATVKVGGDTYTSGFKSNYAYKDAKRVWWANETSYYDYYPY